MILQRYSENHEGKNKFKLDPVLKMLQYFFHLMHSKKLENLMFNANHATLTAVHMDILNMTGEADN